MKKFLVLILSILMIFSMALFVGCFNNKQFKVTFDANGGAQVAGDNVQLSQTVSDVGDLILPTFEREGYEFIGWNVAINEIDEDTVVKALWKACRYQISFDVDGGTWDAGFNNEYKITATFGEEINEPLPTATKAGYTLEKWVIVDSDEAIDGQEFSLPSIYNYSKNIKLKIQWKACEYKISFDVDGGVWNTGFNNEYQVEATFGEVVSGTFPTATKTGFKFGGWKIVDANEEYNGKTFSTTEEYSYAQDLTLKINWLTSITYLISYSGTDSNGLKESFYENDSSFTLVNPTKMGYTFDGWTGDGYDTPTKEITINPVDIKANLAFTANWTANKYKLSFDNNGGEWDTGFNNEYQVEATFDSVVSGTFPTATLAGFKFGGWIIVDANTELNGRTFNPTVEYSYAQDLTLKINWLTSTTYLITYLGTDPNGLKESFYENDKPFTLTNPSKIGYTFDGWTGEGYDSPTKEITINPVDIKANLAFTANWTANKYKLSFDNNGGEWDTGFNNEYQVETTFDSVVSGTFPTATLAGFKFGGWIIVDANAELNGRTFNPAVEYSYAQDLTLKINWVESIIYTISYTGTDSNGLKESFYENDSSFTLINPSKTGYTFDGWTGEGYATPTKEIIINPAEVTDDLTFTAKWTANKYKLSFDNNGGEWDTGFNNEYQVEATFGEVVSGTFPTATLAGFKFGGWIIVDSNAEINGKTFNPAVGYSYAQDLTLKINWLTSTTYLITYLATDSNGLKESFYENDSSFTLTNPSKTGYTFDGWTGEGYATPTKEIIINPAEVTDDLTFTAKWTANKYKLSFDNNGGEWDTGFNNEYQVEATFGEVVSGTLPTATLAGFKFGGWIIVDSNAEINGKTFNPAVGYSYAQDLTLQIKWIDAGLYRINYVNADSNGLIESFYENDSSFTLTNPSKTGYTFDGWTGEGYATPTKEITINPAEVTDDLTFTAKWTAKTYTITLVDRGQPISQKSVVYGQPIGELPAPNESKYFFAGWTYKDYLFDQGNNTQIWMIDEGDITLEAKWTGVLIVYNLNFYNSNKDEYYPCKVNGQSTVEEIVVQTYASLYDAIKDLPDPVPNDASEYKFSYWAYKKNDKYYKITSETLISDADIVNGVITIYARCRSLWIGPF